MVVREGAVDVAIHRDDLAAHALEEFRRQFAGHPIATVNGNVYRTCQLHIAYDLVKIGGFDIGGFHFTRLICPVHIASFNALLQDLNSIACERITGDDHFETIVVWGVMASCDRDAGIGFQLKSCKVSHRCRHATDINGIDTGGHNPFLESTRQTGTR